MRANRFTLKLAAILGLGVALSAKLWREVREMVCARSAERSFRQVARTAVVLVAAVVLPSCVDGFAHLGPGDQPEADLPEWFEQEDEASMLYLRGTEVNDRSIDSIHGEWVAGIITAREAELALALPLAGRG